MSSRGLCRRELLFAIDLLAMMRNELLRMLSWQVGSAYGFTFSVGKNYKFIGQYLPAEQWQSASFHVSHRFCGKHMAVAFHMPRALPRCCQKFRRKIRLHLSRLRRKRLPLRPRYVRGIRSKITPLPKRVCKIPRKSPAATQNCGNSKLTWWLFPRFSYKMSPAKGGLPYDHRSQNRRLPQTRRHVAGKARKRTQHLAPGGFPAGKRGFT